MYGNIIAKAEAKWRTGSKIFFAKGDIRENVITGKRG